MSTPAGSADDPRVAPEGDDATTSREELELELMEDDRSGEGEAIGETPE